MYPVVRLLLPMLDTERNSYGLKEARLARLAAPFSPSKPLSGAALLVSSKGVFWQHVFATARALRHCPSFGRARHAPSLACRVTRVTAPLPPSPLPLANTDQAARCVHGPVGPAQKVRLGGLQPSAQLEDDGRKGERERPRPRRQQARASRQPTDPFQPPYFQLAGDLAHAVQFACTERVPKSANPRE